MTTVDIIGVTVIMGILYAAMGWLWASSALAEIADRRRALRIAWAAPVWPVGLLGLLVWWIGWRALPGLAAAWREAWGGPELARICNEPDAIPEEPPSLAGRWQQPPVP